MNRHRDHLAPSDLTEDQLESVKDSDQIRRLREQKLALRDEVRALYGTLKKAKHADPDRYRHPCHHGPPRTSTHSVSLGIAFLRLTACDGMRESIRFGAMCSESI